MVGSVLSIVRETREKTKEEITLGAYIVWNLWKERNRRVFEHKELTTLALTRLIRDDIRCFNEATRGTAVPGE